MQYGVEDITGKYDLILLADSVESNDLSLVEYLEEDGFVIFGGVCSQSSKMPLEIIFSSKTESSELYLFKKCVKIHYDTILVNVSNTNFNWIDELKVYIRDEQPKTVYLVSQNDEISGVMGLTNCLNREPTNCKFRFLMITKEISVNDELCTKQMRKGLAFNVLRDGNWGTYVYVPMEKIGKKIVSDAAVNIGTVGNLTSLEWE